MVNPAMEGLGNASLAGGKQSYRCMSVGEVDAARRNEEDEVSECAPRPHQLASWPIYRVAFLPA